MSPTLNGREEAVVVGWAAGLLFVIMLGLFAVSDLSDEHVARPIAMIENGQEH